MVVLGQRQQDRLIPGQCPLYVSMRHQRCTLGAPRLADARREHQAKLRAVSTGPDERQIAAVIEHYLL